MWPCVSCEMRLERLAQLRVRRGLSQFRQGFRQLFLRVIRVAEFVNECIVKSGCFGHRRVLLLVVVSAPPEAGRVRLSVEVPMLGDRGNQVIGGCCRLGTNEHTRADIASGIRRSAFAEDGRKATNTGVCLPTSLSSEARVNSVSALVHSK